jgi:hypothetical protein
MNENTSAVAQADPTRPKKKDASARWRKLLEDQRASGLPISAFCRERGIAAASLFAWRRRLAGVESVFKPVKVVATPTPAPSRGDDSGDDAAIELRLAGERRLMVRRGFDRQLLADVIRALESLA